MSYIIKYINQIDSEGLKVFNQKNYRVEKEASDPSAIVLRSNSLHDYELPKSLKAISRAGVGTNNIPIQSCSDRGIVVFNTPGANANAVKELVIMSMLMYSRNGGEAHQFNSQLLAQLDQLDDTQLELKVESSKKQFRGSELAGKKIGIIGLGAIGSMLANCCENFGMIVYGYDPQISIKSAWQLSQTIVHCDQLKQLLSNVDFVSLHLPLLEKTKNFINAGVIKDFKSGTVLLNFSRAGVVNEDDIIASLDQQKLAHYICDFPSKKLIAHPKSTTLPHLGASTTESEKNCAVMSCTQVMHFLEYGNVQNSVNFPNLKLARTKDTFRFTVTNKNIPNVLSGMLAILNDNNVIEMINRSRDDLAYNIFDLSNKITSEQLLQIQNIEGVIAIRTID